MRKSLCLFYIPRRRLSINLRNLNNYVESGRFDSGQKDYFVGIVYFERKEYQKAFEYFSNAKAKSRGRCFKMVWGEKYSQAYKELLMKFGKKSTKKR